METGSRSKVLENSEFPIFSPHITRLWNYFSHIVVVTCDDFLIPGLTLRTSFNSIWLENHVNLLPRFYDPDARLFELKTSMGSDNEDISARGRRHWGQFIVFYFLFSYEDTLIDFRRGGGREWSIDARETYQLVASYMHHDQRLNLPTALACALTGNRTWDLLVYKMML